MDLHISKKICNFAPEFCGKKVRNSIFNTFVSIKYWFCTG